MKSKIVLSGAFAFAVSAACLGSTQAPASPIEWASWSPSFTTGSTGSASGTIGSTSFAYSGEVQNILFNYPSWGPAGTFNGGTIDNAPPPSGGIVQLSGGTSSSVDTIVFATPVVNPVMAIWSLGQPSINASFYFNQPFTIQSGGPSNEYGGSALTQLSLAAFGVEGNGTIQFIGTYSQISWTNPTYEWWYGFTVGAPTPLPAALPLFASGLGALGFLGWRRKRRAAARAA